MASLLRGLILPWIIITLASSETSTKFDILKSCLIRCKVPETQIVSRDVPADRSRYESLNFQWDKLHGQITPLAYLIATRSGHVSAAVRCCRQTGVRVVARSGGHSYLKLSFGDSYSLVVDLHGMSSVRLVVDSATGTGEIVARIGAGTRSGKIQYKIWAESKGELIIPAPTCTTVGIAGFALGGGFDGFFSRQMGLAADNILEARVVDWRGKLLTINNRTHPDLYWALRGGGGGNFGIVTSFKFKTHPAPRRITYAMANYDLNDSQSIIHLFKSWQKFMSPDPVVHIGTWLTVLGREVMLEVYSKDQQGGMAEVERILAQSFQKPVNYTIGQYTVAEFMVKIAQRYSDDPLTSPESLANVTRDSRANIGWKKVKSFYVDRVLTKDEDIAKLHVLMLDYMGANPGSSVPVGRPGPSARISFEQYGGVINTAFSPTDTAFVHRDRTLYDVQLYVYSADGREPLPAVNAMRRFYEATKALLHHTESYQNYLDEDLPAPEYLHRYYGKNLERLVAVKRSVDPHNVFYSSRSIPTSLS